MAQEHLDHPDIDLLLQQVGGKAVPQCVQAHRFIDLRRILGRVKDAAQLARGQMVDRVLTGKEPATRQHDAFLAAHTPPGAQEIEQIVRQHGVAVLAALALLDPDHLALAVDVRDLERDYFRGPEPGAIG